MVLSTFGVMFTPNQEQAARELVRVARPGGRIGDMLRVVGRHIPSPLGLRSPTRWGTEDGIAELLGDRVTALQMTRRTFIWRFASASQYLDLFRSYYGPIAQAFEALGETGGRALARDLLDAFRRHAEPVDGTLLVPAEYLEVIAETTT